jgi:RNA polymerase-binding transcription factor DksA
MTMASSFAFAPAPASQLSEAQVAELNDQLLDELDRLKDPAPGPQANGVRSQIRIGLIVDALNRIRAGIYGKCVMCRLPIAFDRLSVIPETKTCVRCS